MLDLQVELPMKMIVDGRNVTKSIGDDVFVPMAMTRECADDTEGEPGSCRLTCGGVLVCHVMIVLRFP